MRFISLFILAGLQLAVTADSVIDPYSHTPLNTGDCQTVHVCKCNGPCPPVPPHDPNPDPPYTCHGTMKMTEDPSGRRQYECHPNTPPVNPNPPPKHPNPNCNNMLRGYDPRACDELPGYDPECDYTKPTYNAGHCCTTNSNCPSYEPRCDIDSPTYDPRECPDNGNYDPPCDHTRSSRKCVDPKKCPNHPRPCYNPYPDPEDPNLIWACTCGPGQRPSRQNLATGTCIADGTSSPGGSAGGSAGGGAGGSAGGQAGSGTNSPGQGTANQGGNTNQGNSSPGQGGSNNQGSTSPGQGGSSNQGSNTGNSGSGGTGSGSTGSGSTGSGSAGQQPLVDTPPAGGSTDTGSGVSAAEQCENASWSTFCQGASRCTLTEFKIGDIQYAKSCFTRSPGTKQHQSSDYATPASCAAAECNNDPGCFGVGWTQGTNVCTVHTISFGRPARIANSPTEHLIYKTSMSHLL